MCLITFAWKAHPRYRLIVAANRDEYHARPTAPAGFWEGGEILAGRDLAAGGTWLGITRSGRFTAVTNYREGRPRPAPRSRGELTAAFLGGAAGAMDHARSLSGCGGEYSGFSLLLGDGEELVYASNRGQEPRRLEGGLYGLSNHLLDTPWPKVERAKEGLRALLGRERIDDEDLLRLLADRTPAATELLPDTGVGEARERTLSPPFIVSEVYGTRSSSLVLVEAAGEIRFVEQTYAPSGAPLERVSFRVGRGVSAASPG